MNQLAEIAAALCLVLASNYASAQSITLSYDYMATNKAGSFNGRSAPVATLKLTDFAAGTTYVDAAGQMQNNTNGGVRAEFNVNTNGLSQFSSGIGSVYISSFELNFPNTETADSYDTAGAGGNGNNWAYVGGVNLLGGGVEWQEGGKTNGWGEFGQENNWGAGTGSGNMTQTSGGSLVDFFNASGESNISVANIIASSVSNADGTLAPAYSWIKVRSNSGLPANRGIVANGWWGNSEQNNATATGRNSLNILATSYVENIDQSPSAVPVPAALPLMGSALGLFGISRRRKHI